MKNRIVIALLVALSSVVATEAYAQRGQVNFDRRASNLIDASQEDLDEVYDELEVLVYLLEDVRDLYPPQVGDALIVFIQEELDMIYVKIYEANLYLAEMRSLLGGMRRANEIQEVALYMMLLSKYTNEFKPAIDRAIELEASARRHIEVYVGLEEEILEDEEEDERWGDTR